MIDRLASGVDGLDHVLAGGLTPSSIALISGAPGSGKTILAQSYVFENASTAHPAVYLSTVSEPFDKILRFGQQLDAFDVDLVGTAVFYEDLGHALVTDGLDGVLAIIDGVLTGRRPSMLVIDSFKALAAFAGSDAGYRRFLHDLAGRLTALPLAALWIGEYEASDVAVCPEFAVADTVVHLGTRRTADREERRLSVLKHRGSGFAAGEHAYRIGPSGLRVFPRLADVGDPSPYAEAPGRDSTGIPALDDALHDGYFPGSATLVVGPSGVGKTLMGLHFLYSGAAGGEPGILATLQENPVHLSRIVAGFGWSTDDPLVEIMSRSPVDLYLDEWVYDLLDTVERTGARRVVIDSIGDLLLAATDQMRFREYMYSLLQRFSRMGVSCLMTLELPELFRTTRIGELGMSHLSDNVVLLQHVIDGSTIARGLAVLKSRGSDHDARIREFRITPDGIVLGDPFAGQPFST
ncbi:MAG TPA: ATPase domain-containing protein [Acidimicrobiales bacterium]|nr:ATPase domain-containing protein [Acidimicrobiales bacterium]